MLPELLTINEFCKVTNMGRTKAYQEIAAGRLKAVKNGRVTRITRAAMHEWIASLPQINVTREA